MKKFKIGLSILAMGLISTTASAVCSKEVCTQKVGNENWSKDYRVTTKDSAGKEFYLNISNIKKDAHIGLGYATISGNTNPNLSAGVGISATIDDKIYVGTNADLEYQNTQGSSLVGATIEVKGGYVIDNSITAYGIAGVKSVNYPHGAEGAGLGLGIGAEYTLCPLHAVSVEYKSYDVKLDSGIDSYNHNSLGLKYKFFF